MSNLLFRLMSLEFLLKAVISDPTRVLAEAGVRKGMFLLDFGCGPGRYTIPAARIVGPEGRVCALDVHPLARRFVEKSARRRFPGNAETVLSEGIVPLPDRSVGLVLLYDTLHDVADRATALGEILRVLKPGGSLSYRDHHLESAEALQAPLAEGLLLRGEGGGEAVSFVHRRDGE